MNRLPQIEKPVPLTPEQRRPLIETFRQLNQDIARFEKTVKESVESGAITGEVAAGYDRDYLQQLRDNREALHKRLGGIIFPAEFCFMLTGSWGSVTVPQIDLETKRELLSQHRDRQAARLKPSDN
jgi:hypothetical protein